MPWFLICIDCTAGRHVFSRREQCDKLPIAPASYGPQARSVVGRCADIAIGQPRAEFPDQVHNLALRVVPNQIILVISVDYRAVIAAIIGAPQAIDLLARGLIARSRCR